MAYNKEDLRTYSSASYADLRQAQQKLRAEVDKPKLTLSDRVNNFAYSSVVVGITVAPVLTALAAVAAIKNPAIRKTLGVEYNNFDELIKGIEPYMEKNPLGGIYQFAWDTFKWPTIASFAIPTTATYLTLNENKKKDSSVSNATKLSHVERVISERDIPQNQEKERI